MSWWWIALVLLGVAVLLGLWIAFCEWLSLPSQTDPVYGDIIWDQMVSDYDEQIRRINPVAEDQFSNPAGVHIAGYRPQSEANLKNVKFHKEWEERTLRHLDWLKKQDGVDQRWLQIGRTEIEQAFMAVNRAVMQPTRIALPEDANPGSLPANQQPFVERNPMTFEPVTTGTTPTINIRQPGEPDPKMSSTFDKDGNLKQELPKDG